MSTSDVVLLNAQAGVQDMETQAKTRCANRPVAVVIDTRHGRVEYAEFGEGPAVVALHGAMACHSPFAWG